MEPKQIFLALCEVRRVSREIQGLIQQCLDLLAQMESQRMKSL
ncbi:hypothetical protein ACTOB_003038 [Actinoplanes oblitus]|uniref:Uncharacterized protein n=1 Tax=Actinoplanes oblitus TaxID=3040509 RepID=A0ABY8WRF9_9ACTN|nr:hypothetical protein [Actinoplanes oblitus]WIM99387.1 hypothetical protein ACTOB_003038 [Actinoplanes oblitus]